MLNINIVLFHTRDLQKHIIAFSDKYILLLLYLLLYIIVFIIIIYFIIINTTLYDCPHNHNQPVQETVVNTIFLWFVKQCLP